MPEIAPLSPRPDVVDFLLTRRSRPAKTLGGPGPSRAEIETILKAAARVPDHGKLEPWRFVVIAGAAQARLAALVAARASEKGLDAEAGEKAARAFTQGTAIIAVVASPQPSDRIPVWEQTLSAGAACLAAVNAALALGWGANWLTGWVAEDRIFLSGALGLSHHETVAGFIHIGRETAVPAERPRPDMAAKTVWIES